MDYTVLPDNHGRTKLPRFVPGTEGTLLIPRPGAPLTGVHAHRDTRLTNWNRNREWSSSAQLVVNDYHVLPHADHHYVASWRTVQLPNGPAYPDAQFQRIDAEPDPSAAETLRAFWRDVTEDEVEVCTLQRLQPVHVLGEVAPDAAKGIIRTHYAYSAKIAPMDWPADRLLLICDIPYGGEMWTHRGLRLVPLAYMNYEFMRWQHPNGLETIEDLPAPV